MCICANLCSICPCSIHVCPEGVRVPQRGTCTQRVPVSSRVAIRHEPSRLQAGTPAVAVRKGRAPWEEGKPLPRERPHDRSGDRIVGVRFVPLRHQLIRSLADILAVGNRPAESAGGIQALLDLVIGPVSHAQRTVQIDFGGIGSQPFQINRRALQGVEQGGIAQFQQHLAHATLVESRAASDEFNQVIGANTLAQANLWAISIDCLNFASHEKRSFSLLGLAAPWQDVVVMR